MEDNKSESSADTTRYQKTLEKNTEALSDLFYNSNLAINYRNTMPANFGAHR